MTESTPTHSALQAWAETVFAGNNGEDAERTTDLGRAPGHAQYDPADLISVYRVAAESGRHRAAEAKGHQPTAEPDEAVDAADAP